jgi:hypothetical protein
MTDTPTTPAAIVTCHKTYYVDRRTTDPDAFMMSVHVTGQSFTVYATHPDAYEIGAEYALTLTPRAPSTSAPAVAGTETAR